MAHHTSVHQIEENLKAARAALATAKKNKASKEQIAQLSKRVNEITSALAAVKRTLS